MIEFGRTDHGERIAATAGCLFNTSHDVVVSRTDDYGKLLGGVIFYDFTGRSICMHVAGFDPHWINRDMLWAAFHYPIAQLKCDSIFCQLRSSNLKVLEFVKKIGFKQETIIKDVFPDGDMVVGRLRAEECRWLNIKPRHITSGGKNGR